MAPRNKRGNEWTGSQARRTGRRRWLIGGALALAVGVAAWLGLGMLLAASEEEVERFMHIHGLAIAPWAPDDVFLSTHQGLIRIDSDGRWRYVGEERHDFMGFQVNPTEEGVLYSSGHPAPGSNLQNPLGFMVSTDGGVSWAVVALQGQTDFHAMAVQATNGDVIYGWNVSGDVGLYRSSDGGAAWEMLPAETLARSGGAVSLAVHPEDPDTVLAGTRAGLMQSSDGGRSWQPLSLDVPVSAVAFAPYDERRIFAYAVGEGYGLVLSDDGGESWTRLDFVVEGEDAVGYIAPHPTEVDVLYLGSFGENLFGTTDAGASWQVLAEGGVPRGP